MDDVATRLARVPARAQFFERRLLDGYPPIEHHGMLGDGSGSALVAADGSVPWLSVPRFDSPPLCAALLDWQRGGRLVVGPDPETVRESRQWYLDDSAVLVTEARTATALVRLVDALALVEGADLHATARHAAGAFVRTVEVLEGDLDVEVRLDLRGGVDTEDVDGDLALHWSRDPLLALRAESDRPLRGATTHLRLHQGERMWFRLRWNDDAPGAHRDVAGQVAHTDRAWRRWAACIEYEGPREHEVRRSALALKMLDHAESGALVAAATSSLPEAIGGVRNWDYRYVWIRDAAFSVHAFRRVGMAGEARCYLDWVLSAIDQAGRAGVLYDLDGDRPTIELEDPDLEGYRGSAPVRWGNAASDQTQHDAYGELVDCGWQWLRETAGAPSERLWSRLRPLVEQAAERWDTPDHGIWEIRAPDRLFTYSVAMCEVALDRGARLARQHGLPGDPTGWEALARHLREQILTRAWDDEQQSLTETLDGGGLDAAVLALPLRQVIPADHPKMVATTHAIERTLGAGDGLIHRYDPEVSDDGLPGTEGAFLLCTSWMIDNWILQGRMDEAHEGFEQLCDRTGPLGLLPEQIDPDTGAYLGNYPQAFSHVGLLSNAVLLSRNSEAGGELA